MQRKNKNEVNRKKYIEIPSNPKEKAKLREGKPN
jgi:hypothetical protein